MSEKERERLDVVLRMCRAELSRSEAASLLDLSTRQVYRIYRRWTELGDRGVIHQARGGHSGRAQLELRTKVVLLYHASYSDYGPQLFSEVLFEQHGIRLHRETLRRWLIDADLWQRKTHGRRSCKHRRARPRKGAIGMMLQLDGSTHDWFEGRNPLLPKLTLLVLIDDASSRCSFRFSPSEDAQGVFLLLQDHFTRYGLPQSIYIDHGTVYWTDTGATQFQRALTELGIRFTFANSPQAKGRVERCNRTQQDRLIKAMREQKISTIEEANRFLNEVYTEKHNGRFAKTTGLEDVHRPTTTAKLEQTLCFQVERVVRNDYTVTVDRMRWQILPLTKQDRYLLPSPGARVLVKVYLDGSTHVFCKHQELRVRQVSEHEAIEEGMLKTTGRPHKGGISKRVISKQLKPAGKLLKSSGPHSYATLRVDPGLPIKNFVQTITINKSQDLAHGNQ